MPMMIVDDDSFDSELSRSESNPVPVKDNVIRRPFHGRNIGDNNIPSVVREIVANDESSTGKQLSESFGISESSVSAYRHAATSTASYDIPQEKLKEIVDNKLERISNRSKNALMKVLRKMNSKEFDAKLDASKAVELSTIAANMSRVVEKVSPKQAENVTNNNIIFYTPTPSKKSSFEVIEMNPQSNPNA